MSDAENVLKKIGFNSTLTGVVLKPVNVIKNIAGQSNMTFVSPIEIVFVMLDRSWIALHGYKESSEDAESLGVGHATYGDDIPNLFEFLYKKAHHLQESDSEHKNTFVSLMLMITDVFRKYGEIAVEKADGMICIRETGEKSTAPTDLGQIYVLDRLEIEKSPFSNTLH